MYGLEAKAALALVETNTKKGLDDAQVEKRQKHFGLNTIVSEKTSSLLLDVVNQLKNPLALILIAAFVLTIILKEYVDAGVILFAIVINVVIALVQERKAGDAFNALASKRSHDAVVLRDGHEQVISAEQLVPGDIVQVTAGQYVPADGRVINSNRLSVNQVMFTGESQNIDKDETVADEHHIFDRHNMLYMGSTVMTGNGTMVVTQTAYDTQFGNIAQTLDGIEKTLSPYRNYYCISGNYRSRFIPGAISVCNYSTSNCSRGISSTRGFTICSDCSAGIWSTTNHETGRSC